MEPEARTSWFDEARFGMFVHWTHCAQQGRELSWPIFGGMNVLPYAHQVSAEEYYARALDFCPEPNSPHEWMRRARQAGMRYVILTTKHHDGFALFDTRHSEFSVTKAAYGRDIVEEFVRAARAEGLRVGFYHSLSDWHHPDYPAVTADDTTYMSYLGKRPSPAAWERYLETLFGQVRELLTNYGDVDIMWFDGQWERSADEWRAAELAQMVRSLQPDILINDRLPGFGDFLTPEQGVPATPPEGRWETCMTMNRTWGYQPEDTEYKSTRELIHTLCEVAGKGGNLLLNVGPMGNGQLPPEQAERLDQVAEWMTRNGEAIWGTEPGLEAWQFYGPSTRKGNRVFLHLVMRPYETVTVRGVPIHKIEGVRHLASGLELDVETRATVQQELAGADAVGEAIARVPGDILDPFATVIELTIQAT